MRQLFDIVAGFRIEDDLAELDLRFVEDAFVRGDLIEIFLDFRRGDLDVFHDLLAHGLGEALFADGLP